MTAEQWVERFAQEVGLEAPGPEDTAEILKLAAAAAHASERTAAPVACWVAGKTGRPIAELAELAERLEST
ncbi:MAG: hypothetical protein JJE35_14865 [Thermoleophilia bacterium]|nr:hypothetical protein [Thermoleophilia bacterium]